MNRSFQGHAIPHDEHSVCAESVGLCAGSLSEDALAPAKGLVNALILVAPFWAAVAFVALWIWS